MNSMLLTILSVSVSGSVLSLLIFLLKPLIKNRVSKAFSYYIWILVLLRLVFPFGYHVSIPEIPQQFASAGLQGYITPAENVQVSPDTMPNTAGQTQHPPDGNTNIAASGDNPADSGNENLPATGNRFDLWGLVGANLFYIWLAGAIVSLCWYAISYTVFSREISRSFEVPDDDDLAVFRKMIKGETVRLACSSRVNTPMLIGVLRPVVVLPQLAYTANGMGRELYGILRHELTHYHRQDIVYKWLAVFVTSLHWFNPLVYLIRREIGDACELSCDEAVIKNMSISERKGYGNTLLALAAKQRIPASVMATTLCEGKKQLKGRLMGIMHYKKKTQAAIAFMIILALALTGCAAGIAAFGGGSTDNADSISALQGEQAENPVESNQPSANLDETGISPSPNGHNENQEPAQPPENTSIMETYKAVLQGNTGFFSVDANKNLTIDQLNQSVSDDSSVTAKATKFAIMDLDNDGNPEVILWLSVNNDDYYGFEVLRYQNGAVYGYTLWYRSFMDLKANGTFSFSSGAADSGFGTVKFTESAYSIDKITYSESSYDSNNNMSVSYFVDHESATEDAFLSAVNRQSEAADATWYEYADDTIEAMLK
jgi:beta-lactamase regulating signal transducer with metallopeptidase domain